MPAAGNLVGEKACCFVNLRGIKNRIPSHNIFYDFVESFNRP
jgi:hypothetical protein